MFRSLIDKFKDADSYKKRGIIYISIAVIFLLYEFVSHQPPRMPVLLLWLGVIMIAVFVMTTLKDPRK